MSNLILHAKRELAKIGAMKDWEIYEPLIRIFSKQGHSGGSASVVIPTLNKLLNFQPLSPLTNNPNEWMEVTSKTVNGEFLHQNTRCSSVFSRDGGQTWYDIDGKFNNNDTWEKK